MVLNRVVTLYVLPSVISQPCSFRLHQAIVRFHLKLNLVSGGLVSSQGAREMNSIPPQLGGHLSKLGQELFAHSQAPLEVGRDVKLISAEGNS